jgi:phosphopentomutase
VLGSVGVLGRNGEFAGSICDWEERRDLNQAGALTHTYMVRGYHLGYETSARMCFEDFKRYAEFPGLPDFTFFYMGIVDETGHAKGWMSPEYMEATRFSMDIAGEIAALLPEDTLLVVTADHGGIGRSHGSDAPECMTIPLFFYHRGLAPRELEGASIMDIAPTVVPLLGVAPDPEWEGRNLL